VPCALCLPPKHTHTAHHATNTHAIAGAGFQLLSNWVNLNHFSNAATVWLGMRPTFLFFQIFLPPLLVDSALRIDFFLFKKVRRRVAACCVHECRARGTVLRAWGLLC
jgi:hypothetical protein